MPDKGRKHLTIFVVPNAFSNSLLRFSLIFLFHRKYIYIKNIVHNLYKLFNIDTEVIVDSTCREYCPEIPTS